MATIMDDMHDIPIPPQVEPQTLYDFRGMTDGPRGYKTGITMYGSGKGSKRKLEEYAEQVEREEATLAMTDDTARDDAPGNVPAAPPLKRAKHNTVGVGKASGRSWKRPEQRSATLKNPKLSTSWEKKMKDKAEIDALRARKREAAEARKEAAKKEKERLEEKKRRKEENRAKSAITQRVNVDTARKMAKNKKLKKRLVTLA